MGSLPDHLILEGMAPGKPVHLELPVADGAGLRAYLMRFDTQAFDASAFAQHGVAQPPSISRSVPKRQAEYFHGRLMARHALSALGLDVGDIGMGASRQPLWPEGIVGSISHAHGVVGAAVERRGPRSGIGIDIERVASAEACHALSETVVNDRELTYLKREVAMLSLDLALTTVFSAKESFFKAAFDVVGHYFDFSVVRLIDFQPGRGTMRLQLTEHLCDAFRQGDVIDVGACRIAGNMLLTHIAW
ncbi:MULTISPECIES: 4'-phosphopantetheinyl transferase family protein [Dyella]|uniref:Enterobactin synthase component D n=2 Tax=Dyella TaxID=231454 RepID=A0A4R0YXN5_9GAMM|nr:MULTISPECIES: 4'-phosphopantetheinyl transferase superfamily protein [Dyella]TBR39047.1 4'-phosphopantetheinyl transferase superfamily protein [Dyella terrae]TCI13361.1 4'-phosphopantetheinyl transferase superfamily protein [Dyella soli]